MEKRIRSSWQTIGLLLALIALAVALRPLPQVEAQYGRAQPPYSRALISFAASGDNTVVAAVPGHGICVYGMFLTVAGATNLTIKDGSGTSLSGAMSFTASGSGFWILEQPNLFWFGTSLGNAFVINSSNAVQVSGTVYYGNCF